MSPSLDSGTYDQAMAPARSVNSASLRWAEALWLAYAIAAAVFLVEMNEIGWAIVAVTGAGAGPLLARALERRHLRSETPDVHRQASALPVPVGIMQVLFLAAVGYLVFTFGSSGLGRGWGIATGFVGLLLWGFYRTGVRAKEQAAFLEDLREPAPPLPVVRGQPFSVSLPAAKLWAFRIVLALFVLVLTGAIYDVAWESRGGQFRAGLLLGLLHLVVIVMLVRLGLHTLRAVTLDWDRIEAQSVIGRKSALDWGEVSEIRKVRYRGLGRNGLYLYDMAGSLRLVLDASLPRFREIEATVRHLARNAQYQKEWRRGPVF